jgi:hypothetical protein
MQRATASCLTTSAALPSFSAHAGHRPPCSIARHRPPAQFFVSVLVLAWTDDKKKRSHGSKQDKEACERWSCGDAPAVCIGLQSV